MDESLNQRGAPRIPIGYRIMVVTDDEMVAYIHALNLSTDGLLLSPPLALPVGGKCGVVIFLMDSELGRRVVTRGTVVRSDPGGTAIHFQKKLDKDSYAALVALVDSLDSATDP
jgi:hypothetical protein